MNVTDDDKTKGLYRKFTVERTDGSSGPGGKHEHCHYYVLDLDHDPHAPAAIRAYADSCRAEYPALAADLDRLFPNATGQGRREATYPAPDCSTVRFAARPECGQDDMTCPLGNTYVYVRNEHICERCNKIFIPSNAELSLRSERSERR